MIKRIPPAKALAYLGLSQKLIFDTSELLNSVPYAEAIRDFEKI